MTEATRALVRVSVALGRGDRGGLGAALEAAARAASASQVEEALLQSHLFVGYPAMLQALGRWRDLVPVQQENGTDARAAGTGTDGENGKDEDNGTDEAAEWNRTAEGGRSHTAGAGKRADEEDPAGWYERGERVCARVYGGQYERLRANVQALHPALDRWMVADGYGRVLGRPGLALDVRELCIVALLCAQDAPAQLYAHLRGALNAGASAADVEAAVAEATAGLAPERAAAAHEVWAAVRTRARK